MPKSSKKSRSSRSKSAYRFSVHVKKSPRKSSKRTSRKPKKSKSKSKKSSPWLAHVKAVYKEGLKKNKDYKFSQALKDAKKTYKK